MRFFSVRGGVFNTDLVNMSWPTSATVFSFIFCVIVNTSNSNKNGVKMMLGKGESGVLKLLFV